MMILIGIIRSYFKGDSPNTGNPDAQKWFDIPKECIKNEEPLDFSALQTSIPDDVKHGSIVSRA